MARPSCSRIDRVKKKLVKRRATTEGNLAGQCVICKQLNNRAGEDQVLFNLRVVSPRHVAAPSRNIRLGNQVSTSNGRSMVTFQRRSSDPSREG